jgi:hypothetical protein
LPQTYSFTPSLDTQANRAYDKAANIATKVQSAYDIALNADGIAKGTRTTLVNIIFIFFMVFLLFLFKNYSQ